MARGSAMDRTRGRERSRGAQTYTREQAGRDPARSDDARDGRVCGRCSLAEGGGLAGYPGHRHHLARSRRQRPREIEFRGAIRTGQGKVPAGRPGGAHPPAGAQQAPGQQRNGSSIVSKLLMSKTATITSSWLVKTAKTIECLHCTPSHVCQSLFRKVIG